MCLSLESKHNIFCSYYNIIIIKTKADLVVRISQLYCCVYVSDLRLDTHVTVTAERHKFVVMYKMPYVCGLSTKMFPALVLEGSLIDTEVQGTPPDT